KRNTFPGKFIVIEGIDGSGKTTQAKLVAEKLSNAIATKEPTDGPIGKLIREGIADFGKLPPSAIQHLLAADRAVHVEEIRTYLKEGKTVVSDRYLWSSIPYGLADLDTHPNNTGSVLLSAQSILSMYHQFVLPDLSIYLKVPVDVALARIENMGKEKEMYEHRDKLEKIYEGYEWLVQEFPKEFVVIDGEQSVEKVTSEILDRISSIK